MTSVHWSGAALAAVLVFWMVGAYNRLVALRNAIGAALAKLDDQVSARAGAVEPLVAILRGPLQQEQGALDTWLAAQAALREAGDALRMAPVSAGAAAAVVAAEASFAAAGARVLALLEQFPDLQADAEVAALRTALRTAESRLAFARQGFNEAAQRYNEAARQFPTRLLTRLYGFGTAGRL